MTEAAPTPATTNNSTAEQVKIDAKWTRSRLLEDLQVEIDYVCVQARLN
jgi:hypothetical protein